MLALALSLMLLLLLRVLGSHRHRRRGSNDTRIVRSELHRELNTTQRTNRLQCRLATIPPGGDGTASPERTARGAVRIPLSEYSDTYYGTIIVRTPAEPAPDRGFEMIWPLTTDY